MAPWAAVIGSPIAHSMSPVLHRAAWASLGIEGWDYRRLEVDEAALPGFIASLDGECRGLSVTMPDKQAVIPLLDAVDPLAQAVGAVNTVIPAAGVLTGFNTDVHGMATAISEARAAAALVNEPKSAVILGARASASSALPALRQLGVERFTMVARRFDGPGSALAVGMSLGLSVDQVPWRQRDRAVNSIDEGDIIVSTVPRGVADEFAGLVTPRAGQTLMDIVYTPDGTPLADAYERAGAVVAPALEMLLHQAVVQVKLMTGREPDVAAMRAALAAEVAAQR